jgi:hypothetical protein
MKRTIALLLSLTLILCMTAGLAEQTAEKTRLGTLEVGKAFMIQSMIPENYTFSLITSSELNLVGVLSGGEGRPTVYISIAYSEEYAGVERFNDVDEATVQEIRESFLDMDDVVFEDLETAYGTRLLKVTTGNKSFADIYTIYKGYELESLKLWIPCKQVPHYIP